MTKKEKATLERAIKILTKQYEECLASPYVRKPMSRALYWTWKLTDSREKERPLF